MNEREHLRRIEADRQKADFIIYLEGKTDPEMFFALLGVNPPASGIHQNVYIKGLNGASGGKTVKALHEVALANGYGGSFGAGGVFGIIDGDGRDLPTLQGEFDAPYAGPLFSWKAYSIENLLAKAAWPAVWGAPPNWGTVLSDYAPYAALNRVHVKLRTALETLGLAQFSKPQHGQPLLTDVAVTTALNKDKALLEDVDVEDKFNNEAGIVRTAIATSVDDGHALVNGKWLVGHFARSIANKSEDDCREKWCEAVRNAGGLPEVRDLWQRITGNAP